jgi:hypothetical protein
LHKRISGHELPDNVIVQDTTNAADGLEQDRSPQATAADEDEEAPGDDLRVKLERSRSNRSNVAWSLVSIAPRSMSPDSPWPGTFRAGVLEPLCDPKKSWMETAGIGLVAQIGGGAGHVFRKVDVDNNGESDEEELAQLFAKLECNVTSDELNSTLEELDANHDGRTTEEDFTTWHVKSEKQILSRVPTVFDCFDTNHSGTINRDFAGNVGACRCRWRRE